MRNHQTVQLTRGAHSSPEEGVCVMELASMLAGEEFSDRPRSASPVLTRFLRLYNDRIHDERRQDLYAYAARVVGTRASRAVERTRARLCVEWLEARGELVPRLTRMLPGPTAGALAARHAACDGSPEAHRSALALVDRLIACGDGWAGTPSDAASLFDQPVPEPEVKSF
jgi:hypothetical protein